MNKQEIHTAAAHRWTRNPTSLQHTDEQEIPQHSHTQMNKKSFCWDEATWIQTLQSIPTPKIPLPDATTWLCILTKYIEDFFLYWQHHHHYSERDSERLMMSSSYCHYRIPLSRSSFSTNSPSHVHNFFKRRTRDGKKIRSWWCSIIMQKALFPTTTTSHTISGACGITGEHVLDSWENGVLTGIVRVILGRDLQNGRNGILVAIDHETDHVGNVLTDEDDGNVFTCSEFLERVLDGFHRRLGIHHQVIRLAPKIDIPHSR